MKTLILIIGVLLLTANFLFGLLLTAYNPFNMWLNTATIAITIAMLYVVNAMQIKDAFKVTMLLLLPISGLAKLLLGTFAPERINDNLCLIAYAVIVFFEIITLIVIRKVSRCLT